MTWNTPLSHQRNGKLQSARTFYSWHLSLSSAIRSLLTAPLGGHSQRRLQGQSWAWLCEQRCGGGGVQRQRQKGWKSGRHQRRGLRGWNLFVVWRFLFPSSLDRLLQVQKRPDAQLLSATWGRLYGCLDSSPVSPSHSPFLIFLQPRIFFIVKPRDIFPPSRPAGQLVQACLLPRFLQCRQPYWNANWVSGAETTSLINQEAPHSLFTASPSNHFKPMATVNCHQCRHWLSGFISVCLPCQINAFITARCPRRRPQMNISCHL